MLETVKSYIKEIPDMDFTDYYQQYIFSVQDNNLALESNISDKSFNDISKLISKIQKEIDSTL